MDLLICLDDNGNSEGPEFDGPEDQPVWSLYAEDPDEGEFFEEWSMKRLGTGLTYQQALNLADRLGLDGRVIGYR